LSIEKKGLFLVIPLVLQKISQTYQTLLDKVNEDNEDIYRPPWCVGVFIIGKFSSISVFQGLGRGFKSCNSNEMVARGVVATTHIARIVRIVDVGKMVKLQYEATINLFLLVTFVVFVAFLSRPTIGKE